MHSQCVSIWNRVTVSILRREGTTNEQAARLADVLLKTGRTVITVSSTNLFFWVTYNARIFFSSMFLPEEKADKWRIHESCLKMHQLQHIWAWPPKVEQTASAAGYWTLQSRSDVLPCLLCTYQVSIWLVWEFTLSAKMHIVEVQFGEVPADFQTRSSEVWKQRLWSMIHHKFLLYVKLSLRKRQNTYWVY